MTLTFADTYNMITYLTKSDASEGFEQILDFLNVSVIKYALTINPTIYVSYIKQLWSSVLIKKTSDVVRLQALIDRRKVIITEDTVRQALRLDDAKSIDCLPNEERFVALERMGLVRNVDSSSKFYMVDTPLIEGMLVPQQAADDVDDVVADDVAADDVVDVVADDDAEPTLPSPTPEIGEEEEVKSFWVEEIEEAKIDADEDVTLEEVDAEKNDVVQGRLEESKAQVYHIDLEQADKVLSIQDDKPEPSKLKEVIIVVTTAKLMTEVVTAATTTITAAPSAARRRKGLVIRDPEEIATPLIIVHSEQKSKDKGKGIMVEEPKPLKKQAHIEKDEAYARELEAELNKNINWDDVIEQVERKEKQDNAVLRYQALKKKPQTEAQAKKNMMVYLKNMTGFKMDFFNGMSYDDIWKRILKKRTKTKQKTTKPNTKWKRSKKTKSIEAGNQKSKPVVNKSQL
nr:hypothetical protein [Tanacetum cinerariifolium]